MKGQNFNYSPPGRYMFEAAIEMLRCSDKRYVVEHLVERRHLPREAIEPIGARLDLVAAEGSVDDSKVDTKLPVVSSEFLDDERVGEGRPSPFKPCEKSATNLHFDGHIAMLHHTAGAG